MMSHSGSRSRPAGSPAENARLAATVAVRSAILTYFGLIVIETYVQTKDHTVGYACTAVASAAQARSHRLAKHTGCWSRTQKQPRHSGTSAEYSPRRSL